MDLTNFIYDFNLVTTLTVKDPYEVCNVINNGRKRDINYDNSVSLYDIVNKFNTAYLAYDLKREHLSDILKTLGRGTLYGYHSVSDDFALLILEVLDPSFEAFKDGNNIVNFIRRNGNDYFANVDNGKKRFSREFKSKGMDIEREKIKECLDIVRNHDLFLESFRELRNKFIFGNGTTVLFSKIDGEVLDKLPTFTLSFGNGYLNSSDFIEVKFKLGEKLIILYGSSKVTLDDEEIKDKEEKKRIIDELLDGLYINFEYLCGLYRIKESEKTLGKKDGYEI